MLLQIHKSLLQKSISRVAGALNKGSNPQDPSQYLTLRTSGKNFIASFVNQDIKARLTLDSADNLLGIEKEGTFIVQGDFIRQILERTTSNDNVSIDFEEQKSNSGGLTIGNIRLTIPNPISGNEEWQIPCLDQQTIDISTNPMIESKGPNSFSVKGKDLIEHVKEIGMSVGADGGDAVYRNVMFRTSGGFYDLVGVNMNQLAWARDTLVKSSGDFIMTIPYSHVLVVSKMLDPEFEVNIIHNPGNPGTAVFIQEIDYGGKKIGKAEYSLTCSNEPFAKFDKMIGSLNFINTCKMNTQQARQQCAKMALFNSAATKVTLDVGKKAIDFSKSESGKGGVDGLKVELSEVTGDNFQFMISSLHMIMAVNNAKTDEIEWKLSGLGSLSCMVLSPNLRTYFSTFGKKDAQ